MQCNEKEAEMELQRNERIKFFQVLSRFHREPQSTMDYFTQIMCIHWLEKYSTHAFQLISHE